MALGVATLVVYLPLCAWSPDRQSRGPVVFSPPTADTDCRVALAEPTALPDQAMTLASRPWDCLSPEVACGHKGLLSLLI